MKRIDNTLIHLHQIERHTVNCHHEVSLFRSGEFYILFELRDNAWVDRLEHTPIDETDVIVQGIKDS